MKSIGATEARERFADLIHEVSERKERFIIERRGKPCAVVIPLEDLEPIQGRVDQILSEGQQRSKDFADASSDWFWEMDANFRFSYFSGRFTEVTGVPREALLGKTPEETGIPDIDPAVWEKHLADLAAQRSFRNLLYSRTRPDGQVVHLSISGKAIFDEAGNFRGYRGSGSDITEQISAGDALARAQVELELRVEQRTEQLQRSNDRLRREEAKLREILENSPVGVAITTSKKDETHVAGERLLANSALVRMFGEADHDSFIKARIEDSWVDHGQLAAAQKILMGGEDLVGFEVQRRRKDGATWWVSMSSRPIEFDGQDCTIVWHFDVTERKKAEEAQRKNEAYLRALIEANPSSIFLKDLDGRYITFNTAFEEFLGLSRDEIIGRTARELNLFDERHIQEINALDNEVLQTGEVMQREHRLTYMDGRNPTTLMIKFPIFDSDGRTSGLGSMEIDITERKKAEQALRESEERFRRAVIDAPIPIIMHAEDGEVLMISRKWTELSGYIHADIPTILDWTEKAYGGDKQRRDRQRQVIAALYSMDTAGEHEAYITTASGEKRLWEIRNAPLGRLPDGRRFVTSMVVDITARRKAENELRKNEALIRSLIEHSPVAISIKDLDGRYTFVSPAFARNLDMTADQVIGKRAGDIHSPKAVALVTAADRTIMRTGATLQRDEAFPVVFGSATLLVTKFPIQDDDGNIISIGTVGIDITEQMRAEEALRKNEAYLRALIEANPSPIFLKDLDGRYVIINTAFEERLLLRRDEIIDKTMSELHLFDQETIDSISAIDNEVLRTGEVIRSEHNPTLPDGRTATTILAKFPIFGSDRRPTGIGAMETDITEHKEAEKKLRESEKRLRQTTQLARIGYYEWDAVEGRCLFCSDEHARIHGLSPEEYIARTSALGEASSLTHPDDRDAFERAMMGLRNGKPIEIEYRTVTPSGEIHHVREIAEPVFDETGRVVQGIGASQDVTALRLAEERSRQAQKMEAVGQLTGGIAHDFNNLLAVILGNAEIVEDRLGGGDKSAQAIIRAADRGAELTQRLLVFSRRQPLQSEEIDLGRLAHGMGNLLRRTIGETIEVGISPAPGLWSAMADPGQVENALLNLAINARDAMPDGGKLTIAAANATLDGRYVESHIKVRPGDYVELSVSDTGIGMTPEVLEHVFEPFYTTKEVGEGSGLGLSMVYGFARQSGGDVVIHSEPGKGTTVKIYLPRGGEVGDRADPGKTTAVPFGNGETVLVVEDDPDVRALTEAMLNNLGYRVLVAEDAWVGIKTLAAEVRIDLLLSDVVLPGGMSGPDLAVRARALDPGIKILFMSGYAEKIFNNQSPLPHDADLLRKPFRKHELAKRVQQALDRKLTLNPDSQDFS